MAVFIPIPPAGGAAVPCDVYYSMKRNDRIQVGNSDDRNGGSMETFGVGIHTERQLALVAPSGAVCLTVHGAVINGP